MTRVGVIGAGGRMGTATCNGVEADPELELVARITSREAMDELVSSRAQVAVDFTTPRSVKTNVSYCLEHGIHAVVGTSGLSAEDLAELETEAVRGGAAVFVAPNFALGAVLMMRFAALAAPYFEVAEIVERHHERKLDAPSGTALRTAGLMNEQRGREWKAPSGEEVVAGSRGGEAGGMRIHSLRLPGSVAHQEVILGSAGETLTIRHDSLDRASYLPGIILAIKKVGSLTGLTVGLENILDL